MFRLPLEQMFNHGEVTCLMTYLVYYREPLGSLCVMP